MTNAADILPLMTSLAVADAGVYAMWAFQTLLSAGIVIVLARLSMTTNRINRLEDERNRKVDGLEEKLHKASEAKIDARLSDVTHKINSHATVLTATMDKLAVNIRESDKRIATAEMELVKTTANLRDNLRECAPTRDEHEDLKDTVRELAQTVKEVANSNRDAITLDDLRKVIREARP